MPRQAGPEYHETPGRPAAPSRYDRGSMSALPPTPAALAASPADAATLEQIAATRRHPRLRLRRRRHPGGVPAAGRRVRRRAARHSLRDEGELVAGHRAAGARARQRRRRQLHGRGGRRASLRLHPGRHRLHRGGQEPGRTGTGRGPEPAGHQRRVARRARTAGPPGRRPRRRGPGRPARQPRHRRPEPPAHLHRPQVEQVRRADRRGPRPVQGRSPRARR